MAAAKDTPRIGILGPGEMGSAIGSMLIRHGGLDVVTALNGRSELSRQRAADVGLRDVGDTEALVREADVILSVLRPSGAERATRAVAEALKGRQRIFIECNAIPPIAAVEFDTIISRAGGLFVDAAIQSPPPSGPGLLLFASGEHASKVTFLRNHGIDLRVLPGPVGQASAMDLVVGGASKLFEAAGAQIYLAARRWGLEDILEERVPHLIKAVEHLAPLMPSRAARWSEEMDETGQCMHDMGLPGGLFAGAAELFAWIARSEAARDRANIVWPSTQREVVALIAQELDRVGT